ncbi:MAG: hypothetical protein RL131_333 [Bacteroidota bacterium]
MNLHETMETFSNEWWKSIIIILVTIAVLTILPKKYTWAQSTYYPKSIALLLLLNLVIENGYAISTGSWNHKQNLPLHLCGFSSLLGIALMFRFNLFWAELFYFFGLTGGIHSLLTPEFDLGKDGFFYYAYFISHGGLILVVAYLVIHQNLTLRKNSWLRAFVAIQILALGVGVFNYITGSNYMYLSTPPIVENPLIVGPWPWYILVFEALALLHFFVFYKAYSLIK